MLTHIHIIAYGSIDERIIDNLARKENLSINFKKIIR